MKLIQITDLHIGKESEHISFSVDVRKNFLQSLLSVRNIGPDFVVLTGDLCYDMGEPEVYSWIRTQMEAIGVPFYVISGNHDESVQLATSFGLSADLHGQELYYARNLNGAPAFFLDSGRGYMSDQQLDWLREGIRSSTGRLLIFIHHPPLLGAMPFMDHNYPLENPERLLELIYNYPYPVFLFCGHYHTDQVLHAHNLTAYLTPSYFFQIDPYDADFKVDSFQYGFREIDVLGDLLITRTRYFEGNRL